MDNNKTYTTQLQAGLGLIEETNALLELWQLGWSTVKLNEEALSSGLFPGVSARRLRNIVSECFAPRYLKNNGHAAKLLKSLKSLLSASEFKQLLFFYTSKANDILADFIEVVYWDRYSAGYDVLTKDDAVEFIRRGNEEGKTKKVWADSTVERVSSYLPGCCVDYGLLEKNTRSTYKITPFRIEPKVVTILVYDMHFQGLGDNTILSHEDWKLFGLSRFDIADEIKRLSLKGQFLVQTAGDIFRITWQLKNWEEIYSVLA